MNKKQNLIEAASHLFAVQGFDGTPTIQPVKEANVAEPLLDYQFKGKEDLFIHIISSTCERHFL